MFNTMVFTHRTTHKMSFQDQDSSAQEYEDVQQRIAEHKAATKRSLEECSRVSNQTVEVANDTSRELKKQGEQLDHVEATVDHTEQGLTVADSLVKSIDSFWYAINPFKKKPKQSNLTAHRDTKSASDVTASSSGIASRNAAARASQKQKENTKVYGFDEDEVDMLQNVQRNLAVLKGNALGQGEELDKQNKQLERLNEKTEHTVAHTQRTNRKIQSLI